MILFFSSDGNILFQKNVLSALSLPNGYCIHVRYWKEIITESVLKKFNNLQNLEAMHIYVKGNDPAIKDKSLRKVQFFSIRKVQIIDYRIDRSTGLYHFNLELKDFVDPEMALPDPSLLPPFYFVSEGEIKINRTTIPWHKKVEALVTFDPRLKDSIFYHFNLVKYSGGFADSVECLFDKEEESSYFKLYEGEEYIIDLSMMITDASTDNLELYECALDHDNSDIMITNPRSIVLGTKKDNRRYRLITKPMTTPNSFDYLRILSQKKNQDKYDEIYETMIRFNIIKSKRKAFRYMFLFFLNMIGTALFAALVSSGKLGLFPIFGSVILVLVSAWGQYIYYNKS